MNRKQYLLENQSKYTKLLKPLKRDGRKLPPYPLMTMREKYEYNDIYKIGYLDIESSGLVADFDLMFSWAISVRDVKTNKSEIRYDVVKPSDFKLAKREQDWDLVDRNITESLVDAIYDCDALIGHWFIGKRRHDIPFIRTRCAINKVSGFPKHKMVRYGDTQKWGAQIHRLHSYGLGSLADAFGIAEHKTQVRTKHWKNALLGIQEPLDYILKHNIIDVKIEDKVHRFMENYVPLPAVYA